MAVNRECRGLELLELVDAYFRASVHARFNVDYESVERAVSSNSNGFVEAQHCTPRPRLRHRLLLLLLVLHVEDELSVSVTRRWSAELDQSMVASVADDNVAATVDSQRTRLTEQPTRLARRLDISFDATFKVNDSDALRLENNDVLGQDNGGGCCAVTCMTCATVTSTGAPALLSAAARSSMTSSVTSTA